jgi:hypothetical protein
MVAFTACLLECPMLDADLPLTSIALIARHLGCCDRTVYRLQARGLLRVRIIRGRMAHAMREAADLAARDEADRIRREVRDG